jgi:hypothetical protein
MRGGTVVYRVILSVFKKRFLFITYEMRVESGPVWSAEVVIPVFETSFNRKIPRSYRSVTEKIFPDHPLGHVILSHRSRSLENG